MSAKWTCPMEARQRSEDAHREPTGLSAEWFQQSQKCRKHLKVRVVCGVKTEKTKTEIAGVGRTFKPLNLWRNSEERERQITTNS